MTQVKPPAAGGLYLLHFDPPYLHAGHYLGFAGSIAKRVAEHLSGAPSSSPLVRAAIAAGCTVQLSRVWVGLGRTDERRLKNHHGLSRHCPTCRARGTHHP